MSDPGLEPTKITIEYPDGKHTFYHALGSDEWVLKIHANQFPDEDLRVSEYKPADVMRVLSSFVGTKEIAE